MPTIQKNGCKIMKKQVFEDFIAKIRAALPEMLADMDITIDEDMQICVNTGCKLVVDDLGQEHAETMGPVGGTLIVSM